MRSATAVLEIEEVRETCLACARTCLRALYRLCLPGLGLHLATAQVQLMTGCIEQCLRVARGSVSAAQLRQLGMRCAECASICAMLDGMEDCRDACERVEAACGQLSS